MEGCSVSAPASSYIVLKPFSFEHFLAKKLLIFIICFRFIIENIYLEL